MAKQKKKDSEVNQTLKEKTIRKRYNELEYDTDRFGPGSLMTQPSAINASRAIMVNHQLSQFVSIKDPDPPKVLSGFEKVLGSYSAMLEKADGDYKVLAIFQRNPFNGVVIGYDKKRKLYHAWERKEFEEHSEGCCTRYNNQLLDSLEVGDKIPEGTYVKKSTNFDKDMNYCYGRNLNLVYLVSAQVYEDGIQLMNGAENMMVTYHVTRTKINLAENEILLNWNGDDNEYCGLPKVGEKSHQGILAAVRRIDNSKAPYALKKKRLRTIESGDRVYYGDGRVIDIDIRYNKERDNIPDAGANKMIRELYDKQQAYYRDLCRYMRDIIDKVNLSDDGESYTDEFSTIYKEAYNYIDACAFYADSNDSVYGNMMIIVTQIHEQKLIVGSKLVGRSGNKGVVTKILPPEESWHMEDGRPIHAVVAALGIVGRLNPAQSNEHSINELANTVVNMMKRTEDLDTKLMYVHRLMTYLNAKEAKAFKKFYKDMSAKQKAKLCRRIEREGIFIIQEPIDNANIMDLAKAYKEFPADYQRIVFPDGKKSIRKVLCAQSFYMRLKQDPLDKYSLRSRGPINPLTNSPAKSNLKKRGLVRVSDVAVRLGEYEIEVLLAMTNHPTIVARLMSENSTSWPAKMVIAEQLYMGELDDDVDLEEAGNLYRGKKNMELINAYMNVLSSQIDIEFEMAPEGEYFEG